MKKHTAKEIAEHLINTQSLEVESDGTHNYYPHYADGELLDGYAGASFSPYVNARYLDDMWEEALEKAKGELDGLDWDDYNDRMDITDRAREYFEGEGGVWDKESLHDQDFMEIAQELADELNEWLEDEQE